MSQVFIIFERNFETVNLQRRLQDRVLYNWMKQERKTSSVYSDVKDVNTFPFQE